MVEAKKFTPVVAKLLMEMIAEELGGDREEMHVKMDELMVGLLRHLGYDEAMDIFENTDKWHA